LWVDLVDDLCASGSDTAHNGDEVAETTATRVMGISYLKMLRRVCNYYNVEYEELAGGCEGESGRRARFGTEDEVVPLRRRVLYSS
jgi:hypothetical protein